MITNRVSISWIGIIRDLLVLQLIQNSITFGCINIVIDLVVLRVELLLIELLSVELLS